MGEFKKIYSPNDHGSVSWTDLTIDYIPSAFTWYRVSQIHQRVFRP